MDLFVAKMLETFRDSHKRVTTLNFISLLVFVAITFLKMFYTGNIKVIHSILEALWIICLAVSWYAIGATSTYSNVKKNIVKLYEEVFGKIEGN